MDWSILLGDFWNPLHYQGLFDSASDYFTGYTSANQQFRFQQQGMAIQNAYALQNMARQDSYQRNLMLDAPSLQKEGLLKAGFNPMLAVQGGMSSPSSNVSASTPSFSAPTPHGFGLGDIINAVSSAFGNYASLAKLGGDVALTKAQADSTRANSAADVALKGAQAAKTLKEAESLEPDILKRHNRYGTSPYGRLIEDLTLKLYDAFDINSRLRDAKSKQSNALNQVSTNSAKGLDGAVKAINDKFLDDEKLRGEAAHRRRDRSARPSSNSKGRHR